MQYVETKWKILERLYQLAVQLFVIRLKDDNKKRYSQNLLEFINHAQNILKNNKHGLLAHNLI